MSISKPLTSTRRSFWLIPTSVPLTEESRDRLREQRDRLAAAVTAQLPDWRFVLPGGGQFLWLQLPRPLGTALTDEAERHGVIIAPGPVFAAEGGLDQFVRIPWTRPPEELEQAVTRLAGAWSVVRDRQGSPRRTASRVMVA